MIIKHKKRKKNPELQGIAKQILSEVDDWEYLAKGSYGETYYFIIDSPLKINGVELRSGEYILKIEKFRFRNNEEIKYLKELSRLKLIPEIYFIDNKIIIMKYIEGKELDSIMDNLSKDEAKIIVRNIKKLLKKWHDLNYFHNDIHEGNIIVDKKLNVFLIDPNIYRFNDEFRDQRENDNYQLGDLISLLMNIPEKILNPKRKLKRK